jgi:catalase
VFELSKVGHVHVREAMVGHLGHIEEDLANRVAPDLGFDKFPDAPVAAAPVQEIASSPALQTIGKMKDTLMGLAIGILIAEGSDGAVIKKIEKAATDAGATVKVVAPKVGGAKLADGSMLAADGQLAGTPSVRLTQSPSSSPTKAQKRCRGKAPRSISCAMRSVISRQSPSTKAAGRF